MQPENHQLMPRLYSCIRVKLKQGFTDANTDATIVFVGSLYDVREALLHDAGVSNKSLSLHLTNDALIVAMAASMMQPQ